MAVEPIHEWSWRKCRRDPLLYAGRMGALGIMFGLAGLLLGLASESIGNIVGGIAFLLWTLAAVLLVWGGVRKLQGNYYGS